jgi:hypothetical protein
MLDRQDHRYAMLAEHVRDQRAVASVQRQILASTAEDVNVVETAFAFLPTGFQSPPGIDRIEHDKR